MSNLERYRKKAGLTQAELGSKAGGLTQTTIHRYEAGLRKPSLSMCRTLVKALNDNGIEVSLDDVFPPV